MREADIQNQIRLALDKNCPLSMYFRANCGNGWTGNNITKNGRKITIHDARPFNTGLPNGFSDLFGITPIQITEDMVGQTIGVFTAIEVKHKTKPTKNQKNFIELCKNSGSYAGIAYNVEDALKIVNNPTTS